MVVRAPKDLVFISPWDARVRIPPFENEAQNFVCLVLAQRGDRMLLEDPRSRQTMAARINAANARRTPTEKLTDEQRREPLEELARAYG
jgi:hypothetical protein